MLKIIVDATPMFPKPTGVGFYVANLINSLYSLQKKEDFELGVVFQPGMKKWLRCNWSFPESLKKYSSVHLLPMPVRVSNALIDNNFQPILSYFEKYFGYPDILHGTNYTVYPCKKSLKIMNIYDLTFIKYSNYIDSVVKTYTDRVKHCLQWTDLVLTISESSKKDIVEYLQVPSEKVHVTPLASRYTQNYLSFDLANKLEKKVSYDVSRPYLLFVSTLEPRKNVTAIISAFDYLKKTYKIEHNLVLVGRKGWHYKPIFTAIENSPWKKYIYHLNYLDDELVALLYLKADVFVYPSLYEGFGLPILEAMTLGVPVVTSNCSSLPEVAGDAALLIDPNDSFQLAEAIFKIISNSQLRQKLIDKGKERAKLFSWERTAIKTLQAYRTII